MKIAVRFGWLALAAMMSGPALADDDALDCRDWGNQSLPQQAMNMCAGRAYEAADAALNAMYRRLTAGMDAQTKALLTDAQRSWIAYRDRECKYEANENEGGSIHPMVLSGCLARVTNARTRELQCIATPESCSQ